MTERGRPSPVLHAPEGPTPGAESEGTVKEVGDTTSGVVMEEEGEVAVGVVSSIQDSGPPLVSPPVLPLDGWGDPGGETGTVPTRVPYP